MELRQLRYFVAIVDHGSLSRAAQVLHIVQPALTHQVQLLEQELGAQLLHRSAQGMLCTDAGKLFYEHARAILKQVGDAKTAISLSTDRPSGTVALGIPQSVSAALALPLLMGMRDRYPEISLQLTEELSGNLIEQLRSGRINLAVLFDDGQLGSFIVKPLVEEQMLFVARSGSRFVPQSVPVRMEEILQMPLILPGHQHGVRPRIEMLARNLGLSIDHVIDINSVAILKSALLADLGATIQAEAPLQAEIERGDLVALPIDEQHLPLGISRSIVLCASKNIPLTHAAMAVERLVLEVTQMLCATGQWRGAAVR